jgi:hypothetical protein
MGRTQKYLSSILVVCLCTAIIFTTAHATVAVPALSLGFWNEDAPGSTHQYWEFTPSHVTSAGLGGYTATPEVTNNPDPFNVLATITPGRSYDGQTAFSSTRYLAVNLELPNYSTQNPYKEIWVDLGFSGTLDMVDIAVSAGPTNVNYTYEIVAGQGNADFGVKIWPNPGIEKIQFVLFPPVGTTAQFPVTLDYIHVDTICIPEPMTLGLLGLGGLWLRRRIA